MGKHWLRAGRLTKGLLAAAVGLLIAFASLPLMGTAALASQTSSYSGSLTARGADSYYYEWDTSGREYGSVTTTGTLTGFAPGTTYYIYDNSEVATAYGPGTPFWSAAVTANSKGEIVLRNAQLGLPGPENAVSCGCYSYLNDDSRRVAERHVLQYYVSTDPYAQTEPPDDIVYEPPTVMLPNPVSSPWRVAPGTRFQNDYSSVNAGPYSFFGNGSRFCLGREVRKHFHDSWCIRKKTPGTAMLVMQNDGNLVLYAGSRRSASLGRALWQSGTSHHRGDHLLLTMGGRLEIISRSGRLLWSRQ